MGSDGIPTTLSGARARRARAGTEGAASGLDAALALGLGFLTIALRLPWMMHLPWAWDSVLYLRAMFLFNATVQQPQPPGYLFYVSAARLLNLVLHDDHRALVAVSVLAAGVAVGTLYLLASRLYDRLTGLIAAGLLATSVTFWFYSEIAYPYTPLAAGTTVLALVALALRRGVLPGARGAAAAALTWGLLSGFRQDLLLFLAPLFLVAMWGRPAREWAAALGAGAVGVAAWFVPSAALSEGIAKYVAATMGQGEAASGSSSVFTHGFAALQANARTLWIFLHGGIRFALPGIGYALLRRLALPRHPDPALRWLLLWAVPPLVFYLFGHIGDYGYTLSILPAVMVIAARGITLAGRDGAALLAWPAARIRPRPAPNRLRRRAQVALALALAAVLILGSTTAFVRRHTVLSAAGITCFDQTMAARLRIVPERFPPDETLIFSSAYYQHVRYYLPQYQVWFWEPVHGPQAEQRIPAGMRWLVVFEEGVHPPPGESGFASITLPCNDTPFYYTAVNPGDIAWFDENARTISVERRGE